MSIKKQYIPAPLTSAVKNGYVTDTSEILDKNKGKRQDEINQETDSKISDIKGGSTKSIAELSENIANEAERASSVEAGLRESIDELGQIGLDPDNAISTDGNDFDGDTIAKRSKIPTIGAIIDGNPGIYDVSKRNPTGGPNSDGKFTLEYILANANTLIPTSRKHGGMEICFVHSSDNRYVQYKLIADSFSIKISDWQWVDNDAILANELSIQGDGDSLVWQDSPLKVFQGHKYRVYVTTPNVDMAGVTSGYGYVRFILSTSKSTSESLVIVSVGTAFKEYYDITIPNSSGTLYWGGKAAVGAILSIHIEDITAIKENTIKSTVVVAAYDSSESAKKNADVVASSSSNGITAINTALGLLPASGGKIYLCNGNYNGDNYVSIASSNITIEGENVGGVYINRSVEGYDSVIVSSGLTDICLSFLKVRGITTNNSEIIYNYAVVDGKMKNSIHPYDVLIAASNASDNIKAVADFICTGIDDGAVINDAINSLTNGGLIKLSSGTFYCLTGNQTLIQFSQDNVTLQGDGSSTIIDRDGYNAIKCDSPRKGCCVRDLRYKGNLILASGNTKINVFEGTSNLPFEGYSSYEILIAASNAPEKIKLKADYVCDGSNDAEEINNAISSLTNGGLIKLSKGTFYCVDGTWVNLSKDNITLEGDGLSTIIDRTGGYAIKCDSPRKGCIIRNLRYKGAISISPLNEKVNVYSSDFCYPNIVTPPLPLSIKAFRRVGCIGDSYTAGYIKLPGGTATDNPNYSWPHYMEKITGNRYDNFGASGSSSKSWMNGDAKLNEVQAQGKKCQAYIIGLMLNDAQSSLPNVHTDLGTISDIGTSADSYYRWYYDLVQAVITVNPDAKIFCLTSPNSNTTIQKYNPAVRDIVDYCRNNSQNVFLCDLASDRYYNEAYYKNSIMSTDFTEDHYTAIGYEFMAECLVRVLSDVINENNSDFKNIHKISFDE